MPTLISFIQPGDDKPKGTRNIKPGERPYSFSDISDASEPAIYLVTCGDDDLETRVEKVTEGLAIEGGSVRIIALTRPPQLVAILKSGETFKIEVETVNHRRGTILLEHRVLH